MSEKNKQVQQKEIKPVAPKEKSSVDMALLEEIQQDGILFLKECFDEIAEEMGLLKETTKKLKLQKVTKKTIKKFRLSSVSSRELIQDFGIDFRVVPDELDAVSNTPIVGNVYYSKVLIKKKFDIRLLLVDKRIGFINEMLEKHPGNETLMKILEIVKNQKEIIIHPPEKEKGGKRSVPRKEDIPAGAPINPKKICL